jgi:uncharacterized RDD family membrane protein YckC
VDGDPQQMDLTAPPLRRRMACWLYEGILMFAVVFVAGWLFSTLGQMRHDIDPGRLVLQSTLLQVFMFVVFGIYFGWFWSRGQTLAMKTWNIRLVTVQGQRVSQWRSIARYLLSWIWFIPPLAAVAPFHLRGGEVAVIVLGWVAVWALLSRFHPQRQFWHDAWAGTRLIHSLPMSR